MTERKLVGQYAGFLSLVVGLILDYVIIAAIIVGNGTWSICCSAPFVSIWPHARQEQFQSTPSQPECAWAVACPGTCRNHFQPALLCILLEPDRADHRAARDRAASRALNGRRLGFWLSLVRWIGYQLCIFTLGIGFLWVWSHNRRMGCTTSWRGRASFTCGRRCKTISG